jgi:hypothetical protein
MSEQSQAERVELDESTEESNIFVVDPDDYIKTRKLKSIQESKDHYRSFIINKRAKRTEFNEEYINPEEAYKYYRNDALMLFGSELLPLIEEGLEKGGLSTEDVKLPLPQRVRESSEDFGDTIDIRHIVEMGGKIPYDGEVKVLPNRFQNKMYRQLERIERKLGIGLDVEEEKGPAKI